jgi:NAD(P)-dependent dehydrogenase (short-subunit alcohol dehydrogenase family)
MKLNDKVAIVTGGASGFGRAICELFAKDGANVVVADIDVEGARNVAKDIGKAAIDCAVDVSKKVDVECRRHGWTRCNYVRRRRHYDQ